jgi:DNA-binding response OmpR family regulator
VTNKKILIVEDDALLAFDVCDIVSDAGFEVLGPATTVAEALALISEIRIGVAIVDFNLGAETAEGFARTLQAKGTPLLFLSGNSRHAIPAEFKEVPLLSKPVRPPELIAAIQSCLNSTRAAAET